MAVEGRNGIGSPPCHFDSYTYTSAALVATGTECRIIGLKDKKVGLHLRNASRRDFSETLLNPLVHCCQKTNKILQ